jgi:hypothetical protein
LDERLGDGHGGGKRGGSILGRPSCLSRDALLI